MKKKFNLLFLLVALLMSGCTITYSTGPALPGDDGGSTPPTVDGGGSDPGGNSGGATQDPDPGTTPGTGGQIADDLINNPDINAPINIDSNALFYPSTLSASHSIVQKYSYIYASKASNYKIYSAYYSSYYNTIYIAYDTTGTSTQKVKAKDLYNMERHLLYYFDSSNNKDDYKNYLKAVLVYPDTLASTCRTGLMDSSSLAINGCANYVGMEATISLNRISSMANFYESQRIPAGGLSYYDIEPMRYTFAHEFGHVSTFYNMAYKSDEDYEDYLKLRLADKYLSIYPSGLPKDYSSQDDSYYTQPAEVLADDYVEMFYNTSKKAPEDTYDYTLENRYNRNSLEGCIYQNLRDNSTLFNTVKEYYILNFLNKDNQIKYSRPKVITTKGSTIAYYASYSRIGKTGSLKQITANSSIFLIAVGEVTINGSKYYRVILSNTYNKLSSGGFDEKEAGKKMGYVLASSYSVTNSIKLYKLDRNNSSELQKESILPINGSSSIYVFPFYDFSYVIDLGTGSNGLATMYDYLNPNLSNQSYKISVFSFGTEI